MKLGGSKFMVTFDYNRKCATTKWLSHEKKHASVNLPVHILDSVFNKLKDYNHNQVGRRLKTFVCNTECYTYVDGVKTESYRACPKYRNDYDWFDWVRVDWKNIEDDLPAQILMFIDMNTLTFENYIAEGDEEPHTPIKVTNVAVLLHSSKDDCKKQRDPAHTIYLDCVDRPRNSHGPITRIASFYSMEDNYQLVDIDTIASTCFAIVDRCGIISRGDKVIPGDSKNIIVIDPMNSWNKHFLDYSSDTLLEEAAQKRDSNVSENNDRFPFEG